MSETPSSGSPEPAEPHPRPVDVAMGASTLAFTAARRATGLLTPALRPAVGLALRPPLVPAVLQPQTWLDGLGRAGAEQREALAQHVSDVLDVVVPVLVAEVVRRIDLTSLVIDHVDVDAVVAQADPDAVAARVDVDAVSARVDLDAIVERLDLTAIVLERVDLEAVVTAALDKVDLLDLATDVIDGVDLPAIIRESTGAMASETVREVRMHSIAADEAIARAVDRLLLRRTGRSARSKEQPASAPASGPASGPDTPEEN